MPEASLSHGGAGFAYQNCGVSRHRAALSRPARAGFLLHRPLCIAEGFAYPVGRARV
jgi:hypothetical protein